MISVQEALQILEKNIPPLMEKEVPLEVAHGHFSAEDILAPEPAPRYTNSAMDGFALRYADCSAASKEQPARLRLVGESQAGIPFTGVVGSGEAVRISTGAMLPEGADTVVRVEDTRETGESVDVLAVRSLGQDVRYKGEEFGEGSLLVKGGTRLGARELALLAAVGLHRVTVIWPPQVSLLVTGTELASPDDPEIKPHQIRDSNTTMLASAVRDCGGLLRQTVHVEDSHEDTVAAVRQAVEGGDNIILCSGGVSVGQHDHVKDAAKEVGFDELFWKIRQKPGKPLFVCRRGDTLLFGLPGNPVSAFMCFSNYVRPVLAKLQGTGTISRTAMGRMAEKVENRGKRTNFIRVTVDERPGDLAMVREMERQGSHMLSSIVQADGYIILTPGAFLEAGQLVEVMLF